MKWFDFNFDTPAETLACEEALLDWCDETGEQVLGFWEPTRHFVVVGYANKAGTEVNLAACADAGVDIHRRCSGGGTVLQGPGCLNYSLVLQIPEDGWLTSISGTNQFVMHRHREALEKVTGRDVQVRGHTDLACDGRKFSGNAQRRKRRALLFHGTFLCHFDLGLIERFLNFPSLQPDYRAGRNHLDFVMNLEIPPTRIKEQLRATWEAVEAFTEVPVQRTRELAASKYSTREWNLKF